MFKPFSTALAVCAIFLASATAATAQQVKRTELKRADLTGTNMEVITAVVEAPPGSAIPRHFHHGEESAYVIQGAKLEMPDGKVQVLETGTSIINRREVPHAGFRVVGDTTLKLYTTHIVDKGKPLSVAVDQ